MSWNRCVACPVTVGSSFYCLTLAILCLQKVFIGDDTVLRFGGCKTGTACSIVLRGSSQHVLDEAERSLHDAISVLISTLKLQQQQQANSTTGVASPTGPDQASLRSVYGGGNTEIRCADAIDIASRTVSGKQALAMVAFANALRSIPAIIADNGGYDSAELVTQLRAAVHSTSGTAGSAPNSFGLDMTLGTVGNMAELGIRESYQSKKQSLLSASEAACMILRVDDIIKSAPRQRNNEDYGY
jgi:T-complex protein 1 subunit beta